MAMNKIPCGGFYLDNSLTVDYIDNKPILKTAVGGGTKKGISKVNIRLEPSVEYKEGLYHSQGSGYGLDLVEGKKYTVVVDDIPYDVVCKSIIPREIQIMYLTNMGEEAIEDETFKVGDWLISSTEVNEGELYAQYFAATEGEIHSMSVSGEAEKVIPIDAKFTTRMLTFDEIEITGGDYKQVSAKGSKLKFVDGDYVTVDDIEKSKVIDLANCLFYIPYTSGEVDGRPIHIGPTILRFEMYVDDSRALHWSSIEYHSEKITKNRLDLFINEDNEIAGYIGRETDEIPRIVEDDAGNYSFSSWPAQGSCVQAIQLHMGNILVSKYFSATSSSGGTYVLTDDEQHDYSDLRKAITDNRISWAGMYGDTTRSAVLAEYDNSSLIYTYYKIPRSTGTPVTVFTYNAKTKTLSFSYDTGLYIDYFKFGKK